MIGSGLSKLAKEQGLNVAQGVGYGNLQGFAATLSEGSGYKQIVFATKFADSADLEALKQAVNAVNIQRQYRVQTLNFAPRTIHVVFADTVGTMNKIREFLDWFLPLLRQHNASAWNVCAECGFEVTQGQWTMIDDTAYYLHSGCAEKVRREIEAEYQLQKQSDTGSYAAGFVGALLGALVGTVVWALVLVAGYMASLVGLLIGFLADKGYDLLKGKQGKGKIVILIIVIILGVVVGTIAADWIVLAGMVGNGEIPDATMEDIPFMILAMLVMDTEYLMATLGNMAMGLLFAGLGVYGILRKAGKAVGKTKVVALP